MSIKYTRKSTEHYEYPRVSLLDDIGGKYIADQIFEKRKKDVVIYIHIPFCKNNCRFCNYFKVHEIDLKIVKVYYETLKKELDIYRPYVAKVKAIQFGGGTPTCVPLQYYDDLICSIKDKFECEKELQISMESDIRQLLKSDTVDKLTEYGIKRISFGIQTFNNETRQALGLPYSKDELLEKVREIASDSQLDCNVDLMYNLPYQESEDLLDDINCCFEIGINCIDLYHLNVFPGTRMYRWMREKELLGEYCSVSRQNDFYQAYQQLIDDPCINFCMSNTISQRQKEPNIYINMQLGGIDCWQLGIGASARGFVSDAVYRNYVDLNKYIEAVSASGYGIRSMKKCKDLIRRKFVLMPNLLKINISGLVLDSSIFNVIEKMINENIFIKQGEYIKLNSDYYFYAGNVSEEFYTNDDAMQAQKIVMSNYRKGLNMYNQDKMNMR